jgi:integrase/recombinase XerD
MSAIRVLRQVKVGNKWERLPVAKVGDRLDWGRVMKAGKPIAASAGTFFLEYREEGGKRRRAVGDTAKGAESAMLSQAAVLELRKRGVETEDAPEIHARRPREGKTIAEVVKRFLAAPPIELRDRSIAKYKFDINQFGDWIRSQGKTHLCELDREDIRDYTKHLVRTEDLALRSSKNKAIIALKILRDAGATIEMRKGDWPRATEVRPEPYTPEDLKPLFAAMKRDEFVLFQTFLMTGFRDQEMGFASWEKDFNPIAGTMSVTKKPGHSFDPKTYRERTVEIPPELVDMLKAYRDRQGPGEELMFPNGQGKRDGHMLDKLKRIAFKAGLNCGRCEGKYKGTVVSCADKSVCRKWTLHKFRHTYATTLIRDGWDVVSVQHMLGHAELESTLVYVHGLPSAERTRLMRRSSLATQFVHQPVLHAPRGPARTARAKVLKRMRRAA